MDHLLRPQRSEPFHVPLYATADYNDGGDLSLQGFEAYLERVDIHEARPQRQWTRSRIVQAFMNPGDQAEVGHAHDVLQRWAFFGVLRHILQRPIHIRDFSRQLKSRQVVLTTRKLSKLLQEWRQSLERKRKMKDDHSAPYSLLRDIIVSTRRIFNDLWTSLQQLGCSNFLDPKLYISVEILCECLAFSYDKILHDARDDHSALYAWSCRFRTPKTSTPAWVEPWYEKLHKDRNWCPSMVHRLRNTRFGGMGFSHYTNWFFSVMDAPQPKRTHISCTTTRCVAYQVDNSTYRTKHAKDCTGKKARKCEQVFASQEKLAEILSGPATAVPLILLNEPRRDSYYGRRLVDIVPSREASGQPTRRYIALSHVWSDGLGNPQDNAIPICQFRRLGKLVAKLYGVRWPEDSASLAIWFDTLCFPLGPEEAYTTALIRMRQSYEEAERVLVLDEYLLQLRVRNVGDEVEAVSRILISPWNTRLWTLQEARLAPEKRLYFCVKNGLVGEEGGVLGLRSTVGVNRVLEKGWLDMPPAHRLLLEGFHEEYWEMRRHEPRLMKAKLALSFRSTSQPEDEPLCLGNLLGLPSEPLAKSTSREERMSIIWSESPGIRTDVHTSRLSTLFWETERLSHFGFRWAPQTLMDASPYNGNPLFEFRDLEPSQSGTYLDERGLHCQLPAILFPSDIRTLDTAFDTGLLIRPTGLPVQLRLGTNDHPARPEPNESLAHLSRLRESRFLDCRDGWNFAIILDGPIFHPNITGSFPDRAKLLEISSFGEGYHARLLGVCPNFFYNDATRRFIERCPDEKAFSQYSLEADEERDAYGEGRIIATYLPAAYFRLE